MQTTPKGFRLHIGIFGRRNVGKSSLLNVLTRQQSSIVSELAGTTTDPVEKPMELLPIGPVQFIDTAGIDDEGSLGALRIQKTKEIFDRTEIGIVVSAETQQNGSWTVFEQQIVDEFRKRNIPILFVFNKSDLAEPSPETIEILNQASIPFVRFEATAGRGIAELRNALIQTVPDDFFTPPPIVSDLVPPEEMIVLVIPVDKEAPKGRLILPQAQTIRDVLEAHQSCVVVQDTQLKDVLSRIQPPPVLVVTDSQAFAQVAAYTPESIMMTSFSILFARQKGNLPSMIESTRSIAHLRPGAKVLIAESCTHHPIGEDIGTVKIPQWLQKYVGGELDIHHVQGHDFPINRLSEYTLVIHCGACMWNRREVLNRQMHCREANVPMTNYGLTIAFLLGIFDRALKPLYNAKKL
jgi:[FeFe] hydrogenase H-cluster maturation GTPase HydF